MSPAKKSRAFYQLQAGFLLGLFFNPEDGDEIFLRNVGWLSTDYTKLMPEEITLLYN
jgi:hypothetical protein